MTTKPMATKNKPLPYQTRRIPFEKRRGAKVFPNGARMAFFGYSALESWDWDYPAVQAMNFTLPFNFKTPSGKTTLDVRTAHEYAAHVGVPRIREILQEEGIAFTFLTCGAFAEDFPELVRGLSDLGYEQNAHSYSYSVQTPELTRDQQREDIKKTLSILKHVTGRDATGWLSYGAAADVNTIDLCAEAGLLYHCDLQDDELPYFIDINGRTIVELPYRMFGNVNDYMVMLRQSMTLKDALDYFKQSFDACYAAAAHRPMHFNLGTHPWLTGRADCAWVFQEFIRYVKSHEDVWIATMNDVAAWWKKQFNSGYPT
jgi:peptidoglycan/xylan/chitin deacetylase (PgdA/CDA1 family)